MISRNGITERTPRPGRAAAAGGGLLPLAGWMTRFAAVCALMILAGLLAAPRALAQSGSVNTSRHSPVAPDSSGGRMEPLPDELEGVGITEHLDAQLPLDLGFTDGEGRVVRLRDLLDGQRPVVFNLAYYTCPMLCTLVLNGVADAMNGIGLTLGRDYTAFVVSIDPSETPGLAQAKRDSYLKLYQRGAPPEAWRFLVGREDQIRLLAEAVGFGYRYDRESGEFIHTAATFVLTPDGRVSRYLYGIEYEPQTFRLSLLEAAQGRIGTTIDRLVLYCFHYDAEAGRYAPMVLNIVRLFGVLTAAAVAVFLLALRIGDRRRRLAALGAHS